MSNAKFSSEKIINLVEKIASGDMVDLIKSLKHYMDVKKALEGKGIFPEYIIKEYIAKEASMNILLKNSAFVDAVSYEVAQNIKFLEDKLVDLFNLQSSTDNNNTNN